MSPHPLLLLLLTAAIAAVESRRIYELKDENFNRIVGPKSLSLVLFYSPGCQPCMELLGVMQRVSTSLSVSHTDVHFGRVDVSQQPLLAMRHHADEVPLLKAFPHSSTGVTFHGEANEESVLKFLRGLRLQSSVQAGLSQTSERIVGGIGLDVDDDDEGGEESGAKGSVEVTADSFESVVMDNRTNCVLALYTPECGLPCEEFERIAKVFARERHHVVFAKIDVSKETQFARHFMPRRNPTLLWFPRGDKNNIIRYGGDVDLSEIVGFVNDMTGTHRQPDGRLSPNAGRIQQLDRLLEDHATDLVLARNVDELLNSARTIAIDLPHSAKYTEYYLNLLVQLRRGRHLDKVLETENQKILRRLSAGSVDAVERDEQLKLLNIVAGVTDIAVRHLQDDRNRQEEEADLRRRRARERAKAKTKEEEEKKAREAAFKEEVSAATFVRKEEL